MVAWSSGPAERLSEVGGGDLLLRNPEVICLKGRSGRNELKRMLGRRCEPADLGG